MRHKCKECGTIFEFKGKPKEYCPICTYTDTRDYQRLKSMPDSLGSRIDDVEKKAKDLQLDNNRHYLLRLEYIEAAISLVERELETEA